MLLKVFMFVETARIALEVLSLDYEGVLDWLSGLVRVCVCIVRWSYNGKVRWIVYEHYLVLF